MTTLEDAAEALVVKLRGLDSEIEESESGIEDLRERVESVTREVEQEWTEISEAAKSFLEKVREEQEALNDQANETAQAVVDAQNAVAEHGAGTRQELGEGKAQMEGLSQHAAGLAPGVESLASDAGEAPARSLAARARELEQEMDQLVEQARDFLQDEVAPATQEAANEMKRVAETLHGLLAETAVGALQKAYDEWESMVDRLEEYVIRQGYEASRQHASAVVAYAMEACGEECQRYVDDLRQAMVVLLSQLKEMGTEIERSADRLVSQSGSELLQELERTQQAAAASVAALDGVRQELAAYSFVEV